MNETSSIMYKSIYNFIKINLQFLLKFIETRSNPELL